MKPSLLDTSAAGLWNNEIAEAAAKRRAMPGVAGLQQQFVWYARRGEEHAAPAPDGWTLAESDPDAARALAAGSARDPSVPHEMSLAILTAPAEFGVPMKQDRQFTPSFKLQVRVAHGGALDLVQPLGAFLFTKGDQDTMTAMLRHELLGADDPSPAARRASSKPKKQHVNFKNLKGFTRVNALFKAASGMQQGAVAAAATEGSGAQPSLWEPPRGSSTHVKTVDVEFKELEFIDPSRMAPVYILFACAVASRDLLLVVYDIPSVSICRGSQRRKAAENLGLPATAFADIEAFGGHIPECNAMRSADGGAGAAAKRTRTSSGGFGGLQGGPEASPLARASLSQPLDTLIGGLAGGGAGGLVALSKGSGDAGSLGASLGGFPEVAAGAQGSAACALLSTLAATPPNLGLPHEQGLLAAFGQSALLPDTHVNASGALAGSQWPPAPAPGEAAPPYPPPANPAAAPPTLRPHASPPPAKRARADSAAGRRTSDGDRLSVLAEAAAVATERAPDAAAAPPLTEPDMAALRRAVRSAVMESPFLTHATPGLCKSPSNLSRASAMEQNFESVMRLAAAASEVNLEGLNRSSSAGQSGAQSVLAALLQGSAQLDGSGNLDASLPITSGRAVSMSAPGASVTTGAHREYNRDFSCSSASGSGHGARNAVAAAAAAAVAGEDVDRAISLSMFNSGPLRSESGATLDDIAELLRQNPDLTRLLEDVQTAALASRPAVAPPASHA